MKTFVSSISGKTFPITSKVLGSTLRTSIFDLVKEDFPEFSKESLIASSELDGYKEKYISTILKNELGELTRLDQLVIESMNNNQMISTSIDQEEVADSFGERIADRVAGFGGSWTFILSFLGFLVCWIVLNMYWLSNKGFDPYPFILLNLLLSCIAALQAPVIMMSQNRQEDKDRKRAQNDYMVNLKAELEIRTLHEKIDHLLIHKEQELIEMQQFQLDIIKDLINKIDKLERSNNGK